MISLCIPTRKRPEIFKQVCLSVLNNASNPNEIEFVIYHDEDDESKYEHIGNFKEIIGKRSDPHSAANECQKLATGPIYYFGADDFIFQHADWDKKVMDAFEQYPDKILFVYPNNHWHRSNFGNVGFIHKNWIDTVGYFMRPDLVRRGDCWINDVARRINRFFYINGFGVQNLNIKTDETHADIAALVVATQCLEKYRSKELLDGRAKDAMLLQNFINNFKTT